MYMYEKFFPVTKVHGYKIISIQRLAPSHSPPRPNPPAPRHQPSVVERAPWVQNSPASVPGQTRWCSNGPCSLPPPLPCCLPLELGRADELLQLREDVLWRNGRACLPVPFQRWTRCQSDTKTSLGKWGPRSPLMEKYLSRSVQIPYTKLRKRSR